VVLGLAWTAPVVTAHADPVIPSTGQVEAAKAAVGDKAAQVAVIERQLKVSNARLDEVQSAAEVAAEKYNLARILLQERTAAAKTSGKRAAAARETAGIAMDKLGQSAAAAYRQGGTLGRLEVFLSSKGPQEVLDRAADFQLVGDIRSRIMRDARQSSALADTLSRQDARARALQLAGAQAAESARAAAQAQVDLAAAETAKIQSQQRKMVARLATLRHTSVTLERMRQSGLQALAEQRAAAKARADALAQAARNPASQGGLGNVPPPSGRASAVIAFAKAQLGEPYLWGGAGPASWDCSGLTMVAWRQAGVSLPHYTGYQWSATHRVPLSDLLPGDLVFFGSSGPASHHVGLYVGAGLMIEAPRSGVPVRYASIWRADIVPYGGRP
jgi:cell wall-associated NlpC family hydrolase